ncbi:MAG: hypothetical protein SF123_21240 [Chloroflexota bacterium]|nr:hypothetical protein [Chloroflexota bacterium]
MATSQAERLDNTIEALSGDVTQMDGRTARSIEGWISLLDDSGNSSLKPVADNLRKLQTELGKNNLNGGAIGKILSQLGEQTTKSAKSADDNDVAKKIQQIGELLSKAGKSLS